MRRRAVVQIPNEAMHSRAVRQGITTLRATLCPLLLSELEVAAGYVTPDQRATAVVDLKGGIALRVRTDCVVDDRAVGRVLAFADFGQRILVATCAKAQGHLRLEQPKGSRIDCIAELAQRREIV